MKLFPFAEVITVVYKLKTVDWGAVKPGDKCFRLRRDTARGCYRQTTHLVFRQDGGANTFYIFQKFLVNNIRIV